MWKRCLSPGGRAEDARLEGYACPDRKCFGICVPPKKTSHVPGAKLSNTSSSSNRNSSTHEGDDSLHPPLHQSIVVNSREGEEEKEEEERSPDMGSLPTRLPEALVGAGAYDEGAESCLTCRTCGPTSRRVEEAGRHSKSVQELLQQGKASEERGEALAARHCLERAVGRAETWLHRGNWIRCELYSHLASLCVLLQARNTTIAA